MRKLLFILTLLISQITFGQQKFVVKVKQAATSSGGSPNANIGSGYRLAVPFTNNIKTVFSVSPLGIDSVSNTNALTFKLDTTSFHSSAYNDATYGPLAQQNTNTSNIASNTANLAIKYDSTQFILGTVYLNNLQSNSTGFSNWNGATSSYDGTNKRLAVTLTGLSGSYGKGVQVASLTAGHRYAIYVVTTANTVGTAGGVLHLFVNGLSDGGLSAPLVDGDNWETFTPSVTGALTIAGNQNGIFYISYLLIQEVPTGFQIATKGDVKPQLQPLKYININGGNIVQGVGAVAYNSLADITHGQIVIGNNSTATSTEVLSTVLGTASKAYVDPTYGVPNGGQTVIGSNSIGGAWRTTVVGANAQALAVSSTANGYGSYVNVPHASVYGRGGYNDAGGTLFATVPSATANQTFYFGGASAIYTNPAMPGGETINDSAILMNETMVSNLRGVSGRDARPVPLATNIKGGRVNIAGGQSTGTAKGGDVTISITKPGASSNNTINPDFIAVNVSGTDGSVKFNSIPNGAPTDSVVTIHNGVISSIVNPAPTISSGTAVPTTTPTKTGDIFIDTANKKLYFAAGTGSSADWIIAN